VVRASTERFFTADRQATRIHQIAEELPAWHASLSLQLSEGSKI
jgi:hypothetical protein